MTTATIDELRSTQGIADFNLLVLTISGAELLALQGAPRTLATTDWVLASFDSRYVDAGLLADYDAQLLGFERVHAVYETEQRGFGWYRRPRSAPRLGRVARLRRRLVSRT
jgi:hypothetical protein